MSSGNFPLELCVYQLQWGTFSPALLQIPWGELYLGTTTWVKLNPWLHNRKLFLAEFKDLEEKSVYN